MIFKLVLLQKRSIQIKITPVLNAILMRDDSIPFSILKRKVLDVAGLKCISAADCKLLSWLLSKKKDKYISETTVKRIYGFAQAKFKASAYTQDVMAQFCDYDNWADYLSKTSFADNITDQNLQKYVTFPDGSVLLKSFLDVLPIRVSILQAIYGENGAIRDFRIELVNKELEKATGRQDLPGKLYSEEYPGIKLTGLYKLMLKVIETGQSERIEYHYPYDGFNQWFSSIFIKTTTGLLATNCDLTIAKDKLVDANKKACCKIY